ncbi:hypothetical protein LI221_11520 [Faecalimonas umbilicata]|nr:hypothetical protein [Faecalimonas umbilicata]
MKGNLDENMKFYKDVEMKLHLSDEKKATILQNAKKYKRTRVYKRIFVFNFVLALLIVLSLPISTYAAYQGAKAIYAKVKDVNMTRNEIENLDNQIKREGFTEDNIENLNELKENENGQTYGPDMLGADLIEVEMDNGEIGYVYREELYNTPVDLNEAMEGKDTLVLDAYKNDGETKIGQFTLKADDKQ